LIIETHAHLDFKEFDQDRDEVIKRAHEEGVDFIVNIGTNMESSRFSVELAQKYDGLLASVGIHPHDSPELNDDTLAELSQMYQKPKVVAIGEIGLDYYRRYQPADIQKNAFQKQLELALELDAPIIIHNREAHQEILQILRQYKTSAWKGVFHCFPGDISSAETVLNMGFHISFTGVITFKNFKRSDVVKYIPLDRLLLETDCPFMAPVPSRGKRNEPAYVRYIAEKIAEFKSVPFEEVAQQTTINALSLFQMDRDVA